MYALQYELFCLDIKCDNSLIVDFPEHANWKEIYSEMELVTKDDEFGNNTQYHYSVSVTFK